MDVFTQVVRLHRGLRSKLLRELCIEFEFRLREVHTPLLEQQNKMPLRWTRIIFD